MVRPRCADEHIEVMANSPVKDVWTVYQCQHYLYTWRDIEPLRRISREYYPRAFRMTQKDIDDAPVVPSTPPLLVESKRWSTRRVRLRLTWPTYSDILQAQ